MNKDKISASEVNKYIYCPYQWYYEKVYGKEHIKRLYDERNKALLLTDSAKSNFSRGLKFHSEFKLEQGKFRLLRILIFAAIVLLLVLAYFYFKGFVYEWILSF